MKLRLNAKCSDLCFIEVLNDNGVSVKEHDGYVPDFMPDDHYGDYISLDIDPKTGKILNWNSDNFNEFKQWLKKKS